MSRAEKKEPEVIESTELARTDLEPQALIQTAIERGANVETLERLFALAETYRAHRARAAWFEAISKFQAACPTLFKNAKGDTGTFRWKYASLDHILEVVAPHLSDVGLSISWRLIADLTDAGRVTYVCRVSHALGHNEESGPVTIPITARLVGEKGANNQQRVGIAHSYSKRYSCLAILGIAPKDDEGEEAEEPTVAQPRRSSEKPQEKPAEKAEASGNVWVGKVKAVNSRAGRTGNKNWTLYLVKGEDGQEFGTFDAEQARFAEESGELPVEIAWEQTAKGAKKIVTIGPAEPGSGDEA